MNTKMRAGKRGRKRMGDREVKRKTIITRKSQCLKPSRKVLWVSKVDRWSWHLPGPPHLLCSQHQAEAP